jgi:hypothetical protein
MFIVLPFRIIIQAFPIIKNQNINMSQNAKIQPIQNLFTALRLITGNLVMKIEGGF